MKYKVGDFVKTTKAIMVNGEEVIPKDKIGEVTAIFGGYEHPYKVKFKNKEENLSFYDYYSEDMIERYIPLIRVNRCTEDGSSPIKDSGDRTQFFDKSGNEIGRRDMHAGKGRMDLLPVTAIIELSKHCENGALKYGERNVDKGIPQHSFIDSGLRHMFKYLRGDKDENHLVAAAWNIMWALEQEVNRPELNDLPWSNKEK